MRKDHHQIDAELRGHGEYGWEIQLLKDGDFYAGQRFELREQAIAHGDEYRVELIPRGWHVMTVVLTLSLG
jgi:hypothetical protein